LVYNSDSPRKLISYPISSEKENTEISFESFPKRVINIYNIKGGNIYIYIYNKNNDNE